MSRRVGKIDGGDNKRNIDGVKPKGHPNTNGADISGSRGAAHARWQHNHVDVAVVEVGSRTPTRHGTSCM